MAVGNYSYDELLKFYGDKNTTDRIYSEIQFCKQMHNLRPQEWGKWGITTNKSRYSTRWRSISLII